MKKIWLFALALVFLMFIPTIAFASPLGDRATDEGVKLVGLIVGAALTWAAKHVGSWFKRKTGLNIEQLIDVWVDRAIDYAEEQARKQLKDSADKVVMNGATKLSHALQFLERNLTKAGIPRKYLASMKDRIEARLGLRRK